MTSRPQGGKTKRRITAGLREETQPVTYLPPALLPPEALPAELAAVRATAAAAALRPPMSTGLNTEVFRLAAPRGLELKLAAAACTAALRPRGKAEAPMDVEAEAVEDTGEPLSMPTDRPPSSKMHKMLTEAHLVSIHLGKLQASEKQPSGCDFRTRAIFALLEHTFGLWETSL